MKTFLKPAFLFMIVYLSFGCSNNYYNVPRETFEKKVKILGVAPIFVDSESDIRHPEKEALVNLIKEQNRKNEKELVARLKKTGTFFSVRLLDDDADKLYFNVISGSPFYMVAQPWVKGYVYNAEFEVHWDTVWLDK